MTAEPPGGDRAALVDLVRRYAAAVDARDVPAIVACFAPDAHVEFEGGAEVVRGHDDLRAFFAERFARPVFGPGSSSTHLMANVLVTPEGAGAHVETQAVAYLAGADSDTVVVRGLRYSDDCARGDLGWVVTRRVHRSVWQAEMPGRARSPE